MAAAFFKFPEMDDEQAIRTQGQHLAVEGPGHRTIPAATETLRRACREGGNPVGVSPSVVAWYVDAPVGGYMAGREASLLQGQERTQRALRRAQERRDC